MTGCRGSRPPAGAAAEFETLSTAPENVFANGMMKRVFPRVVDQVRALVNRDDRAGESLAGLRDSFLHDDPIPKPSSTHTMVPLYAWRGAMELIGGSWFDSPSYIGEALFYHLLLDAFGYFDYLSSNYERDPFLARKTNALLAAVGVVTRGRASTLSLRESLMASLWGNLSDAAHAQFRGDGSAPGSGVLLVDDLDPARVRLEQSDSVGIVADNAGAELLADVILAAHLLRSRENTTVTVYLKQRPFFISDATANDFETTVSALINADHELSMLRRCVEEGRLRIVTHWFFQSPLHYCQMPPDLAEGIGSNDVTIVKGDLNYRRLLADRVTPATYPLEQLLPDLKTDLLILRTMKSDICAGLPRESVSELDATERDWRFSGRYAVAHFVVE
ncbi:ARMT1-like domain-containing protein [Nocardia wallacei]|uniref:ARMT1-like domain-containing protein n=1 Tax=Nocardia wallacei TaxID=480035 RepID=UPI002454AC54|nr:ARMT1-like domain-containing protein [Nocardia wallacei]